MSEVKTNKISSLASNNDITIDPDGTGDTIIASGNVGIGTSSPDAMLHLESANSPRLRLEDTTNTVKLDMFVGNTTSLIGNASNHDLTFATNDAERMRINTSGHLLINTTSSLGNGGTARQQVYGGTGVCAAFQNTNAGAQTMGMWNSGDSGTRYFVWFESSSGRTHVGSITSNGSSTSYNTSSDYRLKTNVSSDWDATSRLKQLKQARFYWISEGDDAVTVDGFLAHEAQAVVPEAITGTKDEVDDDGNPVYQGIDQAKLVPLLVKTIQELEARITALEAE